MIRATAVLAVVAAGALGLLSALTTGGPSVVERAAAALQSSGDTILHYRLNAEQQNGDGTSVSWHSETWQLLVAPYTRRQIQVGSDGIRAESVSEGDTNELYDADKNTIYIATSQELRAARMPKIKIVSQSKLAKLTGDPNSTAAYLVGNGSHRPTVIATAKGAERLRKELTRQRQESTGEAPEEFRSGILELLESGEARVTGHVEVDGRDAIRIESADGKQVYFVDATTYDPIEWTTTGNGGGVTLRFPVYEELPVNTESMDLLSLEAQHSDAQVVRGAAGYTAAEKRLYPHG
jgi:outer membrane lipoprotein-sorting protein